MQAAADKVWTQPAPYWQSCLQGCRMCSSCMHMSWMQVVGPGDVVAAVPASGQLRLGPGLVAHEDGTVRSLKSGLLRQAPKSGQLWLEGKQRRCGLKALHVSLALQLCFTSQSHHCPVWSVDQQIRSGGGRCCCRVHTRPTCRGKDHGKAAVDVASR